ncbi:MAG: substrate-binding domain-containing protein [Oceanipulchritudo sp.]
MLEGIGSWMRAHRSWVVQRRDSYNPNWKRINDFHPQGIIAEVGSPEMEQELAEFDCPILDISPNRGGGRFPHVGCDNREVGRLQAAQLLGLGHRHFVYAGQLSSIAAKERCKGFLDRLGQEGATGLAYDLTREVHPHPYEEWTTILGEWILQQPLPLAMATPFAEDATNVAQRCLRRGLKIPEQIALISIDDDLSAEEICDPQATVVRMPWEQIGFQAADLMRKMLESPKRKVPKNTVLAPLGIQAHRSTEMIAVDDPALANAVRFMRENAHRPLSVEEAAAECGLSRRVLEKRFAASLKKTPFAEIRFHQLELVRSLLVETDYTIEEIANRSAFAHTGHLIEAFRKAEGCTPGEYRKRRLRVAASDAKTSPNTRQRPRGAHG